MSEPTRHIALVCPGAGIGKDIAKKVDEIAALACGSRARLHFHQQCFFSAGHFAGPDEARSQALLEVANDPKFDAVWFAKGGYGAGRLDPALFGRLNDAARRKIYLGYSDAGVLLARLYKDGVGACFHGPMASDVARAGGEAAIIRALRFLVDGDEETFEPTAREDAPTVAFNITILAHLAGTEWMPDLTGHIVLLEDVSEYLYRIDRAFFSIAADKGFRAAKGVRLGRVSDIPKNDRPFGADEEAIARDWCARAGVPYLGRADIGHDAENKIVPFGRWPRGAGWREALIGA